MTYDYKCNDCKKEFTIEKSMNDDSKVLCTKCESNNIQMIFKSPHIKVNCGGFCGKIG